MDLAARIQQLEELVAEAKSMPLSSSVLVNREEVLELVEEMKNELPEEIKQARWIVKDREELLAKARHEADSIVEHARQEQLKMARQEEIADRATRESGSSSSRIRRVEGSGLEAEDYVDAKLAQFENVLMRVSDEVGSTAGDRPDGRTGPGRTRRLPARRRPRRSRSSIDRGSARGAGAGAAGEEA